MPELSLTENHDAIRALFPVTQDQTYLISAAQSPLSKPSRAAIDSYLDMAMVDLAARPDVRSPVRKLLAGLLGGQEQDYALTPSTGAGISTVAAGIAWQAGDNVVLPAGEHWNSTFPWFNLQARGVEVRTVAPDAEGRVTPEDIAARVDARTRVISLTAVRFDTGFRADLPALSKLAQAYDALLVVDGIQAAGANPLNVIDDGVDVLSCGGFKWLMGQAGTGFLYTNTRARARIAPVAPGMFSAKHSFTELAYHDDGRRYETGTIAYSLLHGWAEGLRLLTKIGVGNIAAHNRKLTDQIIAGLAATGHHLLTPVATPEERSAILTFSTGNHANDTALSEKLAKAKVLVSPRPDGIRISPNFFNTSEDIDRFLNAI